METHSPSLPPLHSGDKKIRPSSYQNSLLQGMNNIDFLFRGDTHIRHNTIFFALLAAAGFARVTPLPPDGFVLVRWERGLCGDFCTSAAPSVLCPAAGRFGRATRSFSLLIGNFHRPVSLEDVNPLSLSLYIFIISRSVHFMNWSCQV